MPTRDPKLWSFTNISFAAALVLFELMYSYIDNPTAEIVGVQLLALALACLIWRDQGFFERLRGLTQFVAVSVAILLVLSSGIFLLNFLLSYIGFTFEVYQEPYYLRLLITIGSGLGYFFLANVFYFLKDV